MPKLSTRFECTSIGRTGDARRFRGESVAILRGPLMSQGPTILAVANQKGGVGKTTTAVNLAASLAALEKRTLLVDMDPQANASSGVGVAPGTARRTIYDALLGEPLAEVITDTAIRTLKVAPASQDLTAVEYELFDENRGTHLRQVLASDAARAFEYIIIDSPPSLGVLTLNVLAAADRLIVPLQPEYYALEGITYLMGTVDRLRGSLNPKLEVEGILLTMWDGRNRLAHEVAAQVRSHFRVFETIIPRNVRLSEAPSYGMPALLYDVQSKGAQGYLMLAKELLEGPDAVRQLVETEEAS